jgi:hypothetical protein
MKILFLLKVFFFQFFLVTLHVIMKKALIWIGLILLSPILLFIILTFLLYLPPVQDWAVSKVTEIASEATGMQISVDRLRLVFPLDLSIEGVKVQEKNDTIADIRQVVAEVQLLPLLQKKVVVDQLELNQAKVNTLDMISDLQVCGSIGQLSVSSRCIDLGEGQVEVNGALLADADITILLSDTAAVDTTTSEPVPWLINVDSVSILRSRVELHMPGDSMRVVAGIGEAHAANGTVDLLHSLYTVKSFSLTDGSAHYDLPFEQPVGNGIDFNHIAVSGLRLAVDSIYFCAPNLALKIQEAALREQSGLELTQLTGTFLMDSTGLKLPRILLTTPYSNIRARAHLDFNFLDSIQPGQMDVDLEAAIGKHDLMLFLADMPERFCTRWPEWPLSIKGQVNGNMEQAHIQEFEMMLPTAFHAKAYGEASSLNNLDNLLAQLTLEAETYNLDFVKALADPKAMQDINLPNGMRLNGILQADGHRYTANLSAHEGKGFVKAKGWFADNTMSYDANVQIQNLNLHHFLPKMDFYELSASAKAKGRGTDFFKKSSWLEANVNIDHLHYGQLKVDSILVAARLNDGHALTSVKGNNKLLRGIINADALLYSPNIAATLSVDLQQLDLYAMQMVEKPLTVGMCGHLDFQSNLDNIYKVSGLIGDIYIRDSLSTIRPDDVGLTIRTQPDTTLFRMQSGDLIVKADASGGYQALLDRFSLLADTMHAQLRERTFRQPVIKQMLPTTRLYVTSGRNNPVANFLRSSADTYFKDLRIDLTTSAEKGINGDLHVYSLNADSTRIDTIRLHLRDSKERLTYQGQVTNNRRNPQFVFNALLDGHIHEKGGVVGIRFYDERNNMGLRLGATASLEQNGVRVKLLPSRPTLGYREFGLNDDNFLFLGRDLKLQANIDLLSDDGSGIKIYSENQDSTMLQDLTVSLNRFDLDKLTSVIPYIPHITGILHGDYHLIMNRQKNISISSDMQIANMTYENSPIGNLSTELVYMQREDDTHAVQALMMLEGKDILELNGSYKNEGAGYLDATLAFHRTPMNIVNGFVPNHLIGLEGYAEGELSVKGATNMPQVDGEIFLDSAFLISQPYGVRLRFDDDPVRIIGSKLLLENFTMYAFNKNPLNIKGEIDFHNTDRITMNVRMRAENFQLINSKQTNESIVYGKAFVNLLAAMSGPLDQLRMRGRVDLLGTTDFTYLLLDSPISTDNRLDELVKFTDFSDSTQTVVMKPKPEGLSVDMTINIDPGARILCGLNADLTNFVDLNGGGDLNMKYNNDGINLTGRYTLTNGTMKYSLPVIPLKTFYIQEGSYVEFTGDIMNPRLNITATERTKATVGEDGGESRSVTFDSGVIITKTLKDMGLEFIIDAPEDMRVSSELNTMTTEQRAKLAVTMLTTGMYMTEANTSNISVNSALSSFLQSEINNITGSALKTIDLSVGLNSTTDATGRARTDYSFKFAKRFWNNRIKVQIGGKVSTGNDVGKQTFFDNVSMEYRLTPTSNQYVKLFYNQNVYDWLEGYTAEYGAGYIYKRKMTKMADIFRIWGKDTQTTIRSVGTTMQRPLRNDSTRTDTLTKKRQ